MKPLCLTAPSTDLPTNIIVKPFLSQLSDKSIYVFSKHALSLYITDAGNSFMSLKTSELLFIGIHLNSSKRVIHRYVQLLVVR